MQSIDSTESSLEFSIGSKLIYEIKLKNWFRGTKIWEP